MDTIDLKDKVNSNLVPYFRAKAREYKKTLDTKKEEPKKDTDAKMANALLKLAKLLIDDGNPV